MYMGYICVYLVNRYIKISYISLYFFYFLYILDTKLMYKIYCVYKTCYKHIKML